ncbi:MAG TPA: hypothetical protein VFX43_08065, partial [Chitinophagaceae bacterium]|nr:hypothetical protein [Chitinophagaceae bacterium]
MEITLTIKGDPSQELSNMLHALGIALQSEQPGTISAPEAETGNKVIEPEPVKKTPGKKTVKFREATEDEKRGKEPVKVDPEEV